MLLRLVNWFFVAVGTVTVVMGVYSFNVRWVPDMAGIAIVIFGICVIFTSLLGFYGCSDPPKDPRTGQARRSGCRRCALLLYFILLFIALMCMVIVGGLMLADTDRLESAFERKWHQLDDADKRAGQDEFRCCGFRDGTRASAATHALACEWEDGANTTAAACPASALDAEGEHCRGCSSAALAVLKRHWRAGFITCVCGGIAICLGVFLSGFILCRSTLPRHNPHVAKMNKFAIEGDGSSSGDVANAPPSWDTALVAAGPISVSNDVDGDSDSGVRLTATA